MEVHICVSVCMYGFIPNVSSFIGLGFIVGGDNGCVDQWYPSLASVLQLHVHLSLSLSLSLSLLPSILFSHKATVALSLFTSYIYMYISTTPN